jgi:hypothetical protein
MPEVLECKPAHPSSKSRPSAARWGWVDFRLGWALVVPLLLLGVLSRNYFYDNPGWLDPNMYVGYFLHYSEHLPIFEDYYKISRLPWVLPGFAAYRVFGPDLASLVLSLGTITFALGCLYLLLRDVMNAGLGLLGVVLLGTCAWFHGVGGWNYHMAAATAYYLLTVLCLIRAANCSRFVSRAGWWYFAAGMALGLTIHTYVFMAGYVPGLMACALIVLSADKRALRSITSAILCVVAGALAITTVLGAINLATGGRFLFFMPVVELILFLSRSNAWHRAGYEWLLNATWLLLPAAALLSCPLTWLFGSPAGKENPSSGRAVAGFQVQFLWAAFVSSYYQFVKHQTTLDWNYLAVSLIGPSVLALCGFIWSVRGAWSQWSPRWIFAVALACIAAPYLYWAANNRGAWNYLAPVAAPGVLACLGLVSLIVGRKTAVGFVAGLLLLGLANANSRNNGSRAVAHDSFLFNIEADRFASDLDPTLNDIKYWFDAKGAEPTTGIFHSYVATRGWGGNLLGAAPPVPLAELQTRHIGDFSQVAVLAATAEKEKRCRGVRERFEALGMPLQFRAERDFHHGDIAVSMTVYRIQKPTIPETEEVP